MKLQQQTTINQPLHHWDSDDYFGLLRFVGLAIAILIFLVVATTRSSADETVQDKSSTETAGSSEEFETNSPNPFEGHWTLHAVSTDDGRKLGGTLPTNTGSRSESLADVFGYGQNAIIKSKKLIYQNAFEGSKSEDLKLTRDAAGLRFTSEGRIGSGTVQLFTDIMFLKIETPKELVSELEFWRVSEADSLQPQYDKLEKQIQQFEGEGLTEPTGKLKWQLDEIRERIKLNKVRRALAMKTASFRTRADLKEAAGESELAKLLAAEADKCQKQLDATPRKTFSEALGSGDMLTTLKSGALVKAGDYIQLFVDKDVGDGQVSRQIIAGVAEVYSGVTDDSEEIKLLITKDNSTLMDSVDRDTIQYRVIEIAPSIHNDSDLASVNPATTNKQNVARHARPFSDMNDTLKTNAKSEATVLHQLNVKNMNLRAGNYVDVLLAFKSDYAPKQRILREIRIASFTEKVEPSVRRLSKEKDSPTVTTHHLVQSVELEFSREQEALAADAVSVTIIARSVKRLTEQQQRDAVAGLSQANIAKASESEGMLSNSEIVPTPENETTEKGSQADSEASPIDLVNELTRIEIGLTANRKQYGDNHRNVRNLESRRDAIQRALAAFNGSLSSPDRSAGLEDATNRASQGEHLTDEKDKLPHDTNQPSPFVGEWRLDSIEPESWQKEFVDDDVEDFEQFRSQFLIRNGILDFMDDERIDLGKSAVRISEDKWEVSLPGAKPAKCWARRFGFVLRLDMTGTGTDLVYEFHRVSPERKNITQQLISLNSQLSASRTAGDVSKSTELQTNISQLNAKLEMLDAQPAVDSLTFMAIRAREKGDHSSARQFENDAKELANKLQQLDPKPESTPKDRLTAALEKIVSLHYDDVPLTEILKEIAKTHQINIALDGRAMESKGLDTDATIKIQVDNISLSSALTLLLEQAGGIGFRIENEVLKLSPDLLGNRDFDRSLLEKQRANLIVSLEDLETESIKLAKNFRAGLAKLPPAPNSESAIETQELARLNIQLKRSVAFAFETRRKLQDVKLQLAELDLIEVKAKHERRGDLANQIIQRRITDLKNGGDLEWSKPSGSKADAAGRSQVQPEETPMMAPPALSLDFQQRRFECKANRWTEIPIQVFNDSGITQSATIRLELPAGVTHRSTESNSEKTVECKITVPANTLTEKLAVLKADTVEEYEIPVTIIHDRKPGVPITIALNVTKSDGTSGTQDDQISASHLKPKIQQEPNVSSSPVASIAAEPVVAPKLASMAKTDIRPFTELSKENLTTAVLTNNGDDSMIVSPNESRGKYINRHLKRGEQITTDMLMDKPSTEQIAGFWLGEAIAGKEVVESMESLSSKYPGSYSNAVNVPFNASYARDYNRNLPSWLPDYLQATEKRLRGVTPVDWSQDEFRIMASLQDLTHYQTVNENHKLEGIGELLTAIVSLNSDSETEDVKDNLAVHSSWLLGQLIRITGHLPDNVLSTKPTTPAVVKKLQLLKTMTQKSADFTWIHQERRRLFGLGQEAPVQALKLLLTSKPISERRLLEKFLYAISAEETYDARHSESSRGLPPPIDPVVVIAVAELLAGHDEITDNNLMWLFTLANPSASFQPFSKHVDELLSSELAYRDSMLELLRSIYAKSKSPNLKKNLALLAPGVTVQGKK